MTIPQPKEGVQWNMTNRKKIIMHKASCWQCHFKTKLLVYYLRLVPPLWLFCVYHCYMQLRLNNNDKFVFTKLRIFSYLECHVQFLNHELVQDCNLKPTVWKFYYLLSFHFNQPNPLFLLLSQQLHSKKFF